MENKIYMIWRGKKNTTKSPTTKQKKLFYVVIRNMVPLLWEFHFDEVYLSKTSWSALLSLPSSMHLVRPELISQTTNFPFYFFNLIQSFSKINSHRGEETVETVVWDWKFSQFIRWDTSVSLWLRGAFCGSDFESVRFFLNLIKHLAKDYILQKIVPIQPD